MSEEQSNFKVTDRRLFNPDGSARESAAPREDLPPAPVNPQESNIEGRGGAAMPAANESGAATAQQFSSIVDNATGAEPSLEERMSDVAPDDEDYGPEIDMDDEDPASFTSFLMSIASNAAAALGLMEHPATGMRAVDLPLAKHWIDTLGMLQAKTQGNLAPREAQILLGLLSDMRMQYVSLTTAASPKGPRKFTGSDIIGGR
ncbi:MAG: DUF1844 domain-containing protein [Pyrinomonadaceae bacterium]